MILIRVSFILHQLHTRACLRAKKTYGLKVLLISNAFGVSVWRVVLTNPFLYR